MSDSPAAPSNPEEDPIFRVASRWLPVLQGLVLCVLLFALVRGLTRSFLQTQEPVSGKQRVEVEAEGKDLQVVAWLNEDQVNVGRTVRVWFTLTNTTAKPLDIRVAMFEAPGFGKPAMPSKGFHGFPFYVAGSERPVPRPQLVLPLPAKASGSFRAEISPSSAWGSSMITTLLTWQDEKGARQVQVVELGPVRRTSPFFRFASNGVETLLALVESLALPLALALVGWFFQGHLQRLAETRQAWASMLPASHKNNTELYLPLVADLKAFQGRLSRFKDSELKSGGAEAFHFLLQAMARMREVSEKGGFYLKNRAGERLVGQCWDLFIPPVLKNLSPYEDLSFVLDSVKPGESLSRHIKKRGRLAALDLKTSQLQEKFRDWIADIVENPQQGDEFCLLATLSLLLEFEMNKIYEFWYGGEEEFPFAEGEALLERLRQKPELKSVADEVDSYIKRLRPPARTGRPGEGGVG